MFAEREIKEKCFFGILFVGGICGLAQGGLVRGSGLHNVFPGAVLCMTATFFGAFFGYFIKDAARIMRGRKAYSGQSDEGVFLGAFFGSFLGAVTQFAIGFPACELVLGAVAGAFVGGLLGALPDDLVSPVLKSIYGQRTEAQTVNISELR
ncbi:MAG: hypothetical protein PHV85_03890 [Desulfovibrionaceae bacterium]|nr:hypothetical protein [Desulfovibrionaceae bacterium]MDD4951674.1 hypothetical protein [Desulfovibrionaceae bacterium]